MNDDDSSREVQDYGDLSSTSAVNDLYQYFVNNGIFPALYDNRECQPGNVNPEEFQASQATSLFTAGSPGDGWGDLELKTAGETAVLAPCDGPLEIVAPSDLLSSIEPVEQHAQDFVMWEEPDVFVLSNQRCDVIFNEQVLETIADNPQPTLSTNVINSLPNPQRRHIFVESTGEPATATFSTNYCPPGTSSHNSVGQANAASSWTGRPATDTLPYLDQLIPMDGMTAPITPIPIDGWHQDIHGQQPFTAPAIASRHSNAQDYYMSAQVEEYSEADYMWADHDAFLLTSSNPRSNANANEQVLETIAENIELTLSANVTNPLANSQGCDNVAELIHQPATTTFSAHGCPPGPSFHNSVGQANAASSWTGGPDTTTGLFRTPPNCGQLSSYPQSTGQAVVASDTPIHFDQFINMDGATAPVPHFPLVGWHQYRRQLFTVPATVSRHSNTQMGGSYSPYNLVARATVAPDRQAYARASMPVYGANPPLIQAPVTGAFPADKWQPHNSPTTTSLQGARPDPYKVSLAPTCPETSGEPELYHCQWVGCSAGPMNYPKVIEHFLAHGEKVKEGDRVKECKWLGCNSKPGAFPMKRDGFRRHVKETQSHAVIGIVTKVMCEKCGEKKARRSVHNCSRKSKEPEDNGKQRQD